LTLADHDRDGGSGKMAAKTNAVTKKADMAASPAAVMGARSA
jgi:hypothetical protein